MVGLTPRRRGFGSATAAGTSELTASLLIQEALGRYAEDAWNGILYTVSSGLVATPAAGPLGAAGTPLLALWNPLNSGYIAVLLRVIVAQTATGTVSPKAYELDAGKTADITQGTVINGVANLVGAPADGDIRGFSAVALTGSSALARLMWLQGAGNAVAQNDVVTFGEDLQGAVILREGALVAITAAVLGTANEAAASITYAKIPTR